MFSSFTYIFFFSSFLFSQLASLGLWESTIVSVMSNPTLIQESQDVVNILEKFCLGGAIIRFLGVGDVHGVVKISSDPNDKANPRSIDRAHATELAASFRVPGNKKDWDSPLFLSVPRDLVEPECLALMKGRNPRDRLAPLVPLQLISATKVEEHALQEALLTQRENGQWLTEDQLNTKKARLRALQQARELAKIINGAHRIEGMIELASEVRAGYQLLAAKTRHQELAESELYQELEALRMSAAGLTWRVQVYDCTFLSRFLIQSTSLLSVTFRLAEMPPIGVHFLAQNEDVRPTKGMDGGEIAWWLSEQFVLDIAGEQHAHPDWTTEQATDEVQRKWRRTTGKKLTVGDVEDVPTGKRIVAKNRTKSSKKASKDTELAGPDGIARLFTEPTALVMIIQCRAANWCFNELLLHSHVKLMISPNGVALLLHWWSAVRNLIKASLLDTLLLSHCNTFGRCTTFIGLSGLRTQKRSWRNPGNPPRKVTHLARRPRSG